ncbi:hypothetical protein JMJ77_0014271 [Colletotrichum scovillei]|uniref:Uncharacterized protein n=1 Tax=Colletotrichum scovillei TaxID=1209932 RepID=A0A9P7R4L9_9PEZI|nr:hypothetical protein JMJ77_0014271 [Colletotrichum scovillei]KAG7065799.1 hypothetical protein JMJ78_0012545 [Colletotrichum scovillei]KAG7068400.1 hypothetical protein JMJ76_0008089 [Colletotrichum scovillei]
MASIHLLDGNDAVTERPSSGNGLPMSTVAFNDPFQDPVRTRRRTNTYYAAVTAPSQHQVNSHSAVSKRLANDSEAWKLS